MPIEYETGDAMKPSSSQYLSNPGWYHLMVIEASDTPTNKDGTPINNAIFSLECAALTGTGGECRDKTVKLTFFHPRPDQKNGGAFARQKIDCTLVALGVVDPEDKEKKIVLDPSTWAGRQFIAHLENGEDSSGKVSKFLELHYTDIFHVDDPAVKEHPKDADALASIHPDLRRIGSRPSKAASPPKTPTPAQEAAAAPMSADEVF